MKYVSSCECIFCLEITGGMNLFPYTHRLVTEAYKDITNVKDKYGIFHKVLFHLHTPASYDYQLLDSAADIGESSIRLWSSFSLMEINRICIECGVYPENYKIDPTFFSKEFDSLKEELGYTLIAHELFVHNYELVIISDHNTISGFKKLKKAVENLYNQKFKKQKPYPEIILGVEISCADKNHVVGFVDSCNEKIEDNFRRLEKYLKEILLNEKDGTYLTSLNVLEKFFSGGGIAYIAHANTSDMFSSNNPFTGGYKKKLFNSEYFRFLGINNKDKAKNMQYFLKNNGIKEDIPFILDSDSHTINTIKDKSFWIKGNGCNFKMVSEALTDADICVKMEKPTAPRCYIKGLLARHNDKAFLSGKPEGVQADFCISFSESLNCFIGGRGTGKSTAINLIEATLRQYFAYENVLEAIFKYEYIWILYEYNRDEYLIGFFTLANEKGEPSLSDEYRNLWRKENLPRILPKNLLSSINERHHFRWNENKNLQEILLKSCINIYKILRIRNDKVECEKIGGLNEKSKLLDSFFGQTYSINELVQNSSGSEKINEYLYKVLYSNNVIGRNRARKFNNRNGLKTFLLKHKKVLNGHEKDIRDLVDRINNGMGFKNKLRIVYKRDPKMANFISFEKIFIQCNIFKQESIYTGKHTTRFKFLCINKKKYNWTYERIIDYLYDCCEQMSAPEFFLNLLNDNYDTIIQKVPIHSYFLEMNQSLVDKDINAISAKNEKFILRSLTDILWQIGNKYIIDRFRNNLITEGDRFVLEFNLANRAGIMGEKVDFRDVTKLSMGQKVVAMLTFVLGYSEYSNDYRPLIMDQPEDNLDSQYIYKNLVDELRTIKSKRQVIIATHNATIVTNAKADQVIVLDSDNQHGWVKASGYPNEIRIKKHILNYLEGGVESFLHKEKIYKDVLKH